MVKEVGKKLIAQNKRARHDYFIEDVYESHGTTFQGCKVGNFGFASNFSFYFAHHMSTIEGGMITTNSKKIADYVQKARNHGILKSLAQRYTKGKPWEYDVTEAGYNYRIDEIRSALGLSQLTRLEKLNLQRRQACKYYNEKFQKTDWISTPTITDDDSCHLYIVKIKKTARVNRNKLFEKLLKHGIRTTVHYKPLHEFTIIKRKARVYDELTNSKKAYNEIISLPLYPQISTKLQNELGWRPSVKPEQGLEKTVDWYLANEEWLNHVTSGSYQKYYEQQYVTR